MHHTGYVLTHCYVIDKASGQLAVRFWGFSARWEVGTSNPCMFKGQLYLPYQGFLFSSVALSYTLTAFCFNTKGSR